MNPAETGQAYAMRRCKPADATDYGLGLLLPLVIVGGLLVVDPSLAHWFLFPLALCGMLIGPDATRWLRGRMDTFDPKGMVGLVGLHFFVAAPMLVAMQDYDAIEKVYVDDWRPWLGMMGFLNAAGLLVYQAVHAWAIRRPSRAERSFWQLRTSTATTALLIVLILAVGAHTFFLVRLGGLGAFLELKTYGREARVGDVRGMGTLMAMGRSIPILLIIMLTVWRYRRMRRATNLIVVNALMVAAIVAQFFIAGLTGSRGSLVWTLFWTVGIVHFFWRRIPVRWVLAGMVPLLAFMYLYAFYKEMGTRALEAIRSTSGRETLEYRTGRTFAGMLIGDFSRADVQAAQLKVLLEHPWDYHYRYGTTYLTSVMPLIPRWIYPNKTDSGKIIAGTEMLSGPGSYAPKDFVWRTGVGRRLTRIYGLAGEAMLNFGVVGILPAFAVFGYVVARLRRRMHSYLVRDSRLLTAPFLCIVILLLLTHDVDNLVARMVFNWMIPALVVRAVSARIPRQVSAAQTVPPLGVPAAVVPR